MIEETLKVLIITFTLGGVLVGLFACYKILQHYLKLRSIEFLLILSFFWGQTYWLFVRLGQVLLLFGYKIGRDFEVTLIERIVLQGLWGVGFVGLTIHLYRVVDWEDYSLLLRRFYQLMVLEGVLEAIFYVEAAIDVYFSGGDYYVTVSWYQQVWFFIYLVRLIFVIFPDLLPPFANNNNGFYGYLGADLWLLVLFILVIYTYIKIEPIHPTREIKFARYFWVFFGLFNCIRWIICIIDTFYHYTYTGPIIPNYPLELFFAGFEFLSLGSILLILAFYPNTLLITKAQLMQANELYKYLHLEKQEQNQSSLLSLVNETNLLIEYVNNLPEDIKSQLSERSH